VRVDTFILKIIIHRKLNCFVLQNIYVRNELFIYFTAKLNIYVFFENEIKIKVTKKLRAN